MQNRLPMKDNLIRRNVLSSDQAQCEFGCGEPESINHPFFSDCPLAANLWVEILNWIGTASTFILGGYAYFKQFEGLLNVSKFSE